MLGTLVQLQVQIFDPVIGGAPTPKSPTLPPTVSINGHILYIYDADCAFTLRLLDEDGQEVYTAAIAAGTASVVLPATLAGTFTLQLIPGGSYYFEGEIEL